MAGLAIVCLMEDLDQRKAKLPGFKCLTVAGIDAFNWNCRSGRG